MSTGHRATMTAKSGPGVQATSLALTNVTEFHVYPDRRLVTVLQDTSTSQLKEFDLTGVTTFTVAIASNNYTITIS